LPVTIVDAEKTLDLRDAEDHHAIWLVTSPARAIMIDHILRVCRPGHSLAAALRRPIERQEKQSVRVSRVAGFAMLSSDARSRRQ